MLHNYTKEGCLFECRLTNAFREIGCLPWDYPIPPSLEQGQKGHIRICNSSRRSDVTENDLAKFDGYMNNERSASNCHCQPDCEAVAFEIQVTCNVLQGGQT